MPKQQTSIYSKLVKKTGFSPAQKLVIDLVEPNSTVLEVGAATGYMTREFTRKLCTVDVIEINPTDIKHASRWATKSFLGSIEDPKIRAKITQKYDFIICADVLEHLVGVEDTLRFLVSKIKKGGSIIISIPNVAFWLMRKNLLLKGDFTYQDSGLLDKTHLRFYSVNGFLKLLAAQNLNVNKLLPAHARIPFEGSLARVPILGGLFLHYFKNRIINRWPNLTYYHYVIKASPK